MHKNNEDVFFMQFNQLSVKSADGLYYLNDSNNLVGLKDKFFVLKKSSKDSYSNMKVESAFGTIGNFLKNAEIKVTVQGFEDEEKSTQLIPKKISTLEMSESHSKSKISPSQTKEIL